MKPTLLFLFSFLLFISASAHGISDSNKNMGKNVASLEWDAKVYPNPNNGVFSIMVSGSSAALNVVVFNIIGEKVFELQLLGDHGAKIDLSKLEKGLYVVQIIDEQKGEVITRRMYIE